MSKRSNACKIPPKVRQAVAERDSPNGYIQCVICGSNQAIPNAHCVPRSDGGLGVIENVVSLCPKCHDIQHHRAGGKEIQQGIENYLRSIYPDWSKDKVTYKKGSYND